MIASALLINVVAQKIIFSRWESYVHHYVINSELAKAHREEAANIIKYAFKLWIWKKSRKPLASVQRYRMKRELFQALDHIREIKKTQREIPDASIGLPEIKNLESSTNSKTSETFKRMVAMETKMTNVEGQLNDVKQSINNIENVLNRLADRIN